MLSSFDLAMASALLLINGVISLVLGLQVHRSLVIAAARMVVQLLLVGLVLRWILALQSPPATLLVILIMIGAAAREVAARPARKLRGYKSYAISGTVVSMASLLTVALALTTAIRPQPWHDPRYAIPLMGIVLGSVLNSASISLDAFLTRIQDAAAVIEARLALGARRREALKPYLVAAIRSGMLPVINQMSAAGIITLPGIMTGQVLAGMDALEAAKYQILLMFILAGASGLAAFGCVILSAYSVTDNRHRLRLDRLAPQKQG
ncbi:iron export ABC transporter permease subunit FetB [Silvimonas amylolytica]|uniref:Iron export ABC transporter permease subunit FetB n=2 Tax=Silvimonas amylolytica TaxID=449663 RepID=A0ABQ2PFZ1_9NEIS|nr:iron export ABC transporter permease subunit FetB [Silvimonas amylolytica]